MIGTKPNLHCVLTRPTTRLPTTHKITLPNLYNPRSLRHQRTFASNSNSPNSNDLPAGDAFDDTAAAEGPPALGQGPLEGPSNSIARTGLVDIDISERLKELQDRLVEAQRALQVRKKKKKKTLTQFIFLYHPHYFFLTPKIFFYFPLILFNSLQLSEERQRALAPYRVSAPRRGIIGNSRYAAALRKQIVSASRDRHRNPVLVFGEPGLQKNNVAALIHFGSAFNNAPLVQIDCERLDDDASELIGRGAKKGLLYWIPNEGTLILNNIHLAPPSVLPILQREVATASVAASMDFSKLEGFDIMNGFDTDDDEEREDESNSDEVFVDVLTAAGTLARRKLPRCRFPRIIMTGEQRVPKLEELATVIKVPPLRVRPEDIDDLARYLLKTLSRQRGLGPLRLTPEALRQLEAGSYPNNVAELQAQVERAVAQSLKSSSNTGGAASGKELIIGEEVFWFTNQGKERLRLDLLRSLPNLRKFLRSDIWPDKINFQFTVYGFAALVFLLFVGPQDRDHNFGLNAFWCYWWPLSFIAYPFLGRVWCSICPFMIYGELVQAVRKATGAKLMKWPKETMDRYGAWFLFWLFAVILVWEEVWDLPHEAALSSWLLLLITFGAMVGSFFFERRIWCRYLCPIGGMNGLFAKLSMTELRARQGVCSAECSTYTCYKGGPAVAPEGQDSVGCPVYSHPAQLNDNRNCVLCMECLKACPHRSIEFRFRVPGADLWDGTHTVMGAEVCLMFMLLGAVYLHDLPLLLIDLDIDSYTIFSSQFIHIIVSIIVMAIPGAVAWGVDAGWRSLAAFSLAQATAANNNKNAAMPQLAPIINTSNSNNPMNTNGVNAETARAISLLQSAAGSYTAQQVNAPIQAPVKPFVDLAYGYLPMVWAGTLAYYLRYGLTEAGRILPVAAATFGVEHVPKWVPVIEAPQEVVAFCQGGCLLFGAAAALGMTRRIAGQPWKTVIPQCGLIIGFTATLWHLILP
jgi:polyferredoxin/transcriptional regulator with AAA-type ATPase domain